MPGSVPAFDGKTDKGLISPGPDENTLFVVRWTGPALAGGNSHWFWFNCASDPHDVGWLTSAGNESWTEPVGTGDGPIHGPTPEPMTIALLALGGLTLRLKRMA